MDGLVAHIHSPTNQLSPSDDAVKLHRILISGGKVLDFGFSFNVGKMLKGMDVALSTFTN